MARIDYYLMVTMVISLLWGVFVMVFGIIFRFSLGQLIGAYVSEVKSKVNLEACVNDAGQNICPVETDISNDIDLGRWAIYLGTLTMFAGILIIVFSAIGLVGALKHNNIMLLMVIVIIILSCALEYWLLQIANDESFTFHEDAKEQLVDILLREYHVDGEENLFTTALNAVMLTGECCGIIGVKDFGNMTFIDHSDKMRVIYFTVPPACCKHPIFNDNPSIAYNSLKKCAIDGWNSAAGPNNINSIGCYTVVFNYVRDAYGNVIMLVLVALVVWEVIQLVLCVLLIFTPPPTEHQDSAIGKTSAERLAKEAAQEATAAPSKPAPKMFVPYSKVSSFVHPDVNRIKSTEIW